MSSDQPQSPTEVGNETVPDTPNPSTEDRLREQIQALTTERDSLQAEVDALRANPMAHLLDIAPLDRSYDFEEVVDLYQGDEMNAFGGLLGELEIPLKRLGVSMGVNQARQSDGSGRESSAGVSKKGSVEFDSVADLLHLPPVLVEELGRRGLVKIVCGNTSWVGADDIAAQEANSTSGAKFKR